MSLKVSLKFLIFITMFQFNGGISFAVPCIQTVNLVGLSAALFLNQNVDGSCLCEPILVKKNCKIYRFYRKGFHQNSFKSWRDYFFPGAEEVCEYHRIKYPCIDESAVRLCNQLQHEINDNIDGKYGARSFGLEALVQTLENNASLVTLQTTRQAVTVVLEALKIHFGLALDCTPKTTLTPVRLQSGNYYEDLCYDEDQHFQCETAEEGAHNFWKFVIPLLENVQEGIRSDLVSGRKLNSCLCNSVFFIAVEINFKKSSYFPVISEKYHIFGN
ncbi:MAG: hypothetical protein AB8G05_09140 [Oligoflexales bacterium]